MNHRRRIVMTRCIGLALAVATAFVGSAGADDVKRPNIVLIMADDEDYRFGVGVVNSLKSAEF
jgi:hypothetical protein